MSIYKSIKTPIKSLYHLITDQILIWNAKWAWNLHIMELYQWEYKRKTNNYLNIKKVCSKILFKVFSIIKEKMIILYKFYFKTQTFWHITEESIAYHAFQYISFIKILD